MESQNSTPPIVMRFCLFGWIALEFVLPLVPFMFSEVNAAIKLGPHLDLPEEAALGHLHIHLWWERDPMLAWHNRGKNCTVLDDMYNLTKVLLEFCIFSHVVSV